MEADSFIIIIIDLAIQLLLDLTAFSLVAHHHHHHQVFRSNLALLASSELALNDP